MFEVNVWAVVTATASSMLVGSVWYTPKVFGGVWMRLAKVSPPSEAKAAVGPLIATVFVSALTAWVLAVAISVAHAVGVAGDSFLANAIVTAMALWAGLTAARFITHDAFEGRPFALTALNIGHELATLMVMALIIGVWPPAT